MTSASRLTARPLDPGDTAFALAAVNTAQPQHPWVEGELLTHWRTEDRMGRARRFVLDEGGRPTGWISAAMRDVAPSGEGRLMVFVPGAGEDQLDQAWTCAEEAAGELGVRLALTNIWETDVPVLSVLLRRGWEEKRRERFWSLELAGQGDRLREQRDAARRRVERAGLRVATAAELGGEAAYPDLHELEETTAADIPRDLPRVPMPYDVWLEWFRPPAVLPERVWIALSDEGPIGLSHLDYRAIPVTTGYTGVLRAHRGAGVARALKLETLVQAVELGVETVETDNDSQNAPILHINEDLGYREIPGIVRLWKPL